MRAQNPKRSKAYRFYRYKLRSTKFSAHFEPSRRRNSQKTPKTGPFWAVLASIFSTIARKSSTIVLQRARWPKTVRNLRHGVPTDCPHLSFYRTARRYRLQRPPRPLFVPKMGVLAPCLPAGHRGPWQPKKRLFSQAVSPKPGRYGPNQRALNPSKPWFWW